LTLLKNCNILWSCKWRIGHTYSCYGWYGGRSHQW